MPIQTHEPNQCPPRLFEAAVSALLPYSKREYVLGDLRDRYVSPRRYLLDGLEMFFSAMATQLVRSFHPGVLAAQAAALAVAFAGAGITLPLLIVLAAVVAALTFRDAFLHPDQSSAYHAGVDAVVALVLVLLSQVLAGLWDPALMLPLSILLRGCALMLIVLSAVRAFFRWSPELPPRMPSFSTSRNITYIWLLAASLLLASTVLGAPELFPGQHFLYGFLFPAFLGLGFRLNKNVLERADGKDGVHRLFEKAKARELHHQRFMLWGHPVSGPEGLALVVFASPIALLVFDPAGMDWMTAATHGLAAVAMSVLWIYIRRSNAVFAESLDAAIDALAEKRP